jgi:HEAT repeat protein
VPLPAEQLQRLVKDLEDRRFSVRNQAARQLERALDQATPMLRRVLDGGPTLETRQRVERLLDKLPAEQVRVHRAVAVLERVGTPEARQLLERFAKGPRKVRLTEEAEEALRRLGRRVTAAR